MKVRTKKYLRQLARGFGCQIKYVDYLPDDTHGKLIPCEGRIIINTRKPQCEHVFTILHEIGHMVIDVKGTLGTRQHWLMTRQTRIDQVDELLRKIRRRIYLLHLKQKGRERDVDIWAMLAFCFLVNHGMARAEFLEFLERNPDKISLMIQAQTALMFNNLKVACCRMFRLVKSVIV